MVQTKQTGFRTSVVFQTDVILIQAVIQALVLVSNNNMHIDIKPYFCLPYRSILKYQGMRCFPLGDLPNSFATFSISSNVNKDGVSALAVSEI